MAIMVLGRLLASAIIPPMVCPSRSSCCAGLHPSQTSCFLRGNLT